MTDLLADRLRHALDQACAGPYPDLDAAGVRHLTSRTGPPSPPGRRLAPLAAAAAVVALGAGSVYAVTGASRNATDVAGPRTSSSPTQAPDATSAMNGIRMDLTLDDRDLTAGDVVDATLTLTNTTSTPFVMSPSPGSDQPGAHVRVDVDPQRRAGQPWPAPFDRVKAEWLELSPLPTSFAPPEQWRRIDGGGQGGWGLAAPSMATPVTQPFAGRTILPGESATGRLRWHAATPGAGPFDGEVVVTAVLVRDGQSGVRRSVAGEPPLTEEQLVAANDGPLQTAASSVRVQSAQAGVDAVRAVDTALSSADFRSWISGLAPSRQPVLRYADGTWIVGVDADNAVGDGIDGSARVDGATGELLSVAIDDRPATS